MLGQFANPLKSLQQAAWPSLLSRVWVVVVVFDAVNLCLLSNELIFFFFYACDPSSGLWRRVVVHRRCICQRESWRFGSRRKAWGFQW